MNDELFDGATPVPPGERGGTFGLEAPTYTRMAKCALRAAQYANIQPAIIRKLRDRSGCELVLYGNTNQYTVRVDPRSCPCQITLYFLPLDSKLSGPGCEMFRGYDEFRDWHKMTDAMVWREAQAGSAEMIEWMEIDAALREANGWV